MELILKQAQFVLLLLLFCFWLFLWENVYKQEKSCNIKEYHLFQNTEAPFTKLNKATEFVHLMFIIIKLWKTFRITHIHVILIIGLCKKLENIHLR